ncbi:protein of unknown function [Streptomyces murinus]
MLVDELNDVHRPFLPLSTEIRCSGPLSGLVTPVYGASLSGLELVRTALGQGGRDLRTAHAVRVSEVSACGHARSSGGHVRRPRRLGRGARRGGGAV